MMESLFNNVKGKIFEKYWQTAPYENLSVAAVLILRSIREVAICPRSTKEVFVKHL